jgi:hypothetical protein
MSYRPISLFVALSLLATAALAGNYANPPQGASPGFVVEQAPSLGGVPAPVTAANPLPITPSGSAPAALADGTANPTTALIGAANELWNGATWDRQRGNVDTAALQTLTLAAAGTTTSADQINYSGRGVKCTIDITATTAQTLTVSLQGKDPVSGKYVTYASSAALAAVATTSLTMYPGITTTANVAISDVLPRTWRTQAVVAAAGNTLTATVACSVIL